MSTQPRASRLDRLDELVLMIFAVLVPIFAIPAMLGI
jgi:hypothetical protein